VLRWWVALSLNLFFCKVVFRVPFSINVTLFRRGRDFLGHYGNLSFWRNHFRFRRLLARLNFLLCLFRWCCHGRFRLRLPDKRNWSCRRLLLLWGWCSFNGSFSHRIATFIFAIAKQVFQRSDLCVQLRNLLVFVGAPRFQSTLSGYQVLV